MALLACIVLALAALPAVLLLWNLYFYRQPPRVSDSWRFPVSVLIPARNEELTIEAAVRSALASRHVDLEVIVLDDSSQDGTAAIVASIAESDQRVRLASAPPLPVGWCGKQFACDSLSRLATKPTLCFVDADVRLTPDGLARIIAAAGEKRAVLMSGFPWQQTETPAEQLLLPLMHFLLLGFLPMMGMRKTIIPAFAAGCGQIFVADRAAYRKVGGHAAIKDSRHDGITLPRAFRDAGFKTDLCDATDVAHCRMYAGASQVFYGLLKNATEGLASPGRIVPFSMILLLGQVLPLPLLFRAIRTGAPHRTLFFLTAAAVLSYLPRAVCAVRYRQPLLGVVMHPVSIFILLGIQWIALVRSFVGVPSTWKGRTYSRSTT